MRTSKRSLISLLAGLGCALTMAGVTATAKADIMPGSAGEGWPNTVKNCFQAAYGTNGIASSFYDANGVQCADRSLLLIVPVPVSSAGTKTLSVRAYGNTTGPGVFTSANVSCRGVATSSTAGGSFSSTAATTGTTATYQTLSLGSLSVPSGSTLQFECTMNNDTTIGIASKVVSVSW